MSERLADTDSLIDRDRQLCARMERDGSRKHGEGVSEMDSQPHS